MGMVVGKCTRDTHLFISFTSNVHIFRMMIMIGGSRRRGRVCHDWGQSTAGQGMSILLQAWRHSVTHLHCTGA